MEQNSHDLCTENGHTGKIRTHNFKYYITIKFSNKDYHLLGCDAIQYGRNLQMFQRNMLPPSSGHVPPKHQTGDLATTVTHTEIVLGSNLS
jgi:hypothetical protein